MFSCWQPSCRSWTLRTCRISLLFSVRFCVRCQLHCWLTSSHFGISYRPKEGYHRQVNVTPLTQQLIQPSLADVCLACTCTTSIARYLTVALIGGESFSQCKTSMASYCPFLWSWLWTMRHHRWSSAISCPCCSICCTSVLVRIVFHSTKTKVSDSKQFLINFVLLSRGVTLGSQLWPVHNANVMASMWVCSSSGCVN